MAIKHHNHEYDGGTPNIPVGVGDRYYAQDLGRDFWHQIDQATRAAWQAFDPWLLTTEGKEVWIDGEISKGAGDTLDIPAGKGFVWHNVRVPDSFAGIPPTSKLEDLAIPVQWTAQNDLAVAGATLDGASTNYIKAKFADVSGASRARAKKAGSYIYEKTFGAAFTVNTTAPTKYDVVIGTLVGTTGNFTIVTYLPDTGSLVRTMSLEESAAVGDLILQRAAGRFVRHDTTAYINGAGSVSGASICWLTDNLVIHAYVYGGNAYFRAGTVNADLTVAWGTAQSVAYAANVYFHCRRISDTLFAATIITTDSRVVVGSVAGTVITLGAVTQFSASQAINSQLTRLSDTKFCVVYSDAGATNFGAIVAATIAGTTPTFGTPVNFGIAINTIDCCLTGTDEVNAFYAKTGATDLFQRLATFTGTVSAWGTEYQVTQLEADVENNSVNIFAVAIDAYSCACVYQVDYSTGVKHPATLIARMARDAATGAFNAQRYFIEPMIPRVGHLTGTYREAIEASFHDGMGVVITMTEPFQAWLTFFKDDGEGLSIGPPIRMVAVDYAGAFTGGITIAIRNGRVARGTVNSSGYSGIEIVQAANVVGVARKAGTFVPVAVAGYASGFTGLTPGKKYYAHPRGGLTTTPYLPEALIGNAISATEMLVKG